MANDDYATVNEDSNNNQINVLLNDTDPDDDPLTITSVTQPSQGTSSQDGNYAYYTPIADYYGSDSFTYTINDDNGGTSTATVYITVAGVNDLPVANDDTVTVDFNITDNIIDVLANDDDPDGDVISIDSIVSQPMNGTATKAGDIILYTPNEGFIGTNYFEYNITDGKGGNDTAVVTVNVVKEISGVIVKPRKEYLYLINRELFKITNLLQFIEADALVIGPITINVEFDDSDFEAKKVEF